MGDLADHEYEIEFLTGVDGSGHVAPVSYQNWRGDTPATYSNTSGTMKWGEPVAGSAATVTYAFDPASHWTATEQGAFLAAMHLWQAEAGITFVGASSAQGAQITIERTQDGQAEGYISGSASLVGSAQLGTGSRGGVQIDTSVTGFGPLGRSFTFVGGYAWMTELHELGHAIGLGHAGPYDGEGAAWSQSSDDSMAQTIMSYFGPGGSTGSADWGNWSGYYGVPVTPMPLDIAAVQRLYGLPVDSPLAGDVTFGFHTNVQGDIAQFFDFAINTSPVVTLWSGGGNNVLDLSGYSTASNVTLEAGKASSVAGLTHNVAIAYGTRIDTLVLGAGNDTVSGNDDSDNILGGAGADSITGGKGNDHLYGAGTSAMPEDGNDWIFGAGGGDYIQGNGGADTLLGGLGSDRIYGGAGDDSIVGDDGNDSLNGNLGNDRMDGGDGRDLVRGGQGNDVVLGGRGDDVVMGDYGNDWVAGGVGMDTMIGGDGYDSFAFTVDDATFGGRWDAPGAFDLVADFQDGIDHFRIGSGPPATVYDLGVQDSSDAAAASAQAWIAAQPVAAGYSTGVAVASVGNDTLVFFSYQTIGMEGFRVANIASANITGADFF